MRPKRQIKEFGCDLRIIIRNKYVVHTSCQSYDIKLVLYFALPSTYQQC